MATESPENDTVETVQPILEETTNIEPKDTPGVNLCDKFTGILDHEKVQLLIQTQKHIIKRLEVSNVKMEDCLHQSSAEYKRANQVFRDHTKRLISMKNDVQSIHQRIRILKYKLAKKYPEVVAEHEKKFAVQISENEND